MQRIFDIIFSCIALILFSPFLLPLMCILRITGEGEIFFQQNRVGRGGEHFILIKFATMLKNSADMATGTITVHNDPRILPMGGFLRKTKINELPQLINVFKGDMSVIGPRPQTQRCFDAFPLSSQEKIIKVRPGLSGVGSIVFRNEEEMMHANDNPNEFYDELVMPYKGRLEEWYVNNACISLYFKLIFITINLVLFNKQKAIWAALKKLPEPPKLLKKCL
ncbi:sugar transferase [Planktomarina sp.]|nr:sugar transferase [Planktomarina sp.]MDA9100750.1 sugar transferase [Planktomarina sp.]